MGIKAVKSILLIIALAGCQPILQHQAQQQLQQRIVTADQRFATAKEACTKGKLTKQNAVARADCTGNARIQWVNDSGYPGMWVIQQQVEADHQSAVAYSKGKITQQEYDFAREQHAANSRSITATEAQQETRHIQQQQTIANITNSYQPKYYDGSNSCPGCEQASQHTTGPDGASVDNGLMDSYAHKSERSNPYNGVGAQGWDGKTYVPAGADPNPSPDVMR